MSWSSSSRELDALLEENSPELVTDPKWMAWRSADDDCCIVHVVACDRPELLHCLLKTKGGLALMDHTDRSGKSPVYSAVVDEKKESVRLLIAAGAHSSCISANDCPLNYAFAMSFIGIGHRKQGIEMGVVLLSSRRTRAERFRFLDDHKKFRNKDAAWKFYFDLCVSTANLRCARAYQAIGTMLYCLKRSIGKNQKDVFHQILTPMLRHIWEHQRYKECWDVPEHQESQSN